MLDLCYNQMNNVVGLFAATHVACMHTCLNLRLPAAHDILTLKYDALQVRHG